MPELPRVAVNLQHRIPIRMLTLVVMMTRRVHDNAELSLAAVVTALTYQAASPRPWRASASLGPRPPALAACPCCFGCWCRGDRRTGQVLAGAQDLRRVQAAHRSGIMPAPWGAGQPLATGQACSGRRQSSGEGRWPACSPRPILVLIPGVSPGGVPSARNMLISDVGIGVFL